MTDTTAATATTEPAVAPPDPEAHLRAATEALHAAFAQAAAATAQRARLVVAGLAAEAELDAEKLAAAIIATAEADFTAALNRVKSWLGY